MIIAGPRWPRQSRAARSLSLSLTGRLFLRPSVWDATDFSQERDDDARFWRFSFPFPRFFFPLFILLWFFFFFYYFVDNNNCAYRNEHLVRHVPVHPYVKAVPTIGPYRSGTQYLCTRSVTSQTAIVCPCNNHVPPIKRMMSIRTTSVTFGVHTRAQYRS